MFPDILNFNQLEELMNHKKQSIDAMSSNKITLQSYELSVNEYTTRTAAEVSGNFKAWIDTTLGFLPLNARIIEIGSAFGRDARYMESLGFTVERTDATQGFVTLLQQEGYPAHRFNILLDDFTSIYDLVFANAVFLHFTAEELQKVLGKINATLREKGILAFSVKKGEGEEWTTAKVGQPRYFCYWSTDKIKRLLESTGFDEVMISEDEKFLQIIAKR